MLDLTARPVKRYTVLILLITDLSSFGRLTSLAKSLWFIPDYLNWLPHLLKFDVQNLVLSSFFWKKQKTKKLCRLLWYLHTVRFIHFSMQVMILIIATTTTAIKVWNRSKSLLVLLYSPPSSSPMPQATAEMSQEFCLFYNFIKMESYSTQR